MKLEGGLFLLATKNVRNPTYNFTWAATGEHVLHVNIARSLGASESIGDARAFDRLKDSLTIEEKERLLSYFMLEPGTELQKCRKAELHIQLCSKEDTAKAFELLKGCESQLGRALMLQVYAAMGEPELVRQNLPKQLEPAQALEDIEAHYHFMRWAAWLYWTEGKLEAAKMAYYKAIHYAESLGLEYALKVLKRDLAELKGEMSAQDETGNPNLINARHAQSFKALAPNFENRHTLGYPHQKLANSVYFRQSKKYGAALGALHGLSFTDPEMKLYLAMQRLELSWRLTETVYTEPEHNKKLAEDLLKTLAYLPDILTFVGQIFPAAAVQLGLSNHVPILTDKRLEYAGDSLRLPAKAIPALQADILLGSSRFLKLDKDTKSRARAKLKSLAIEPHMLMIFFT